MSTNKLQWSPAPAEDMVALMDVLFTAASGLKTQVLASNLLSAPKYAALKTRLDAIADELNGLQADVASAF